MRILDIIVSFLAQAVKMIGRIFLILLILSLVVLVLGSILSAVITIVTLIDNPGVSLTENFWEYYVRNFTLVIKTFGIVAAVLFMAVPVRLFFDD
jgi:hypothetical protein